MEKPSTVKSALEERSGVEIESLCQLCVKRSSRYTCPRCHIRYCCLECYKSKAHAECSETFYKNCFMEGLNDHQASAEDRTRMLEMLTRLEAEQPALHESDDEDIPSLEERLSGLNLDNESDLDQVWERLSTDERKEFQSMVQNGCLANLVSPWIPWWTEKHNDLIEEIGTKIVHPKSTLPTIVKDIPPLSQLLKGRPASENIKFSVVNCLYGYAYIARLYNGDYHSNCVQAAQEVLEISSGLDKKVFTDTSKAVHDCMCVLRQESIALTRNSDFSTAVLRDVINIIEGPSKKKESLYVTVALSELHEIMRTAKHSLNKEIKNQKNSDEEKTALVAQKHQLFVAQKKISFFLSWLTSHHQSLPPLVADLELEFCTLSTELASHSNTKQRFERHWGGKMPPKKPSSKLVEEIL